MKSLFNQSDSAEIILRINKLTPNTKAQWGKMDVAQMMGHVATTLKTASGEMKLSRTFFGMLFGAIAKKKLTSDKAWDHNMPADKRFIVADPRNFEKEKVGLISAVHRFSRSGPEGVSKEPHPFFGSLTTEEWDRLMWNHLNHHLQQFGA